MIIYHGSNHRFEKPRISGSLTEKRSTAENEGAGLYFSTDRSVAESYGKYLYVIEIDDKDIMDFRKKSVCKQYVNDLCAYMLSKTGIDVTKYADINSVINYASFGGIAISEIGKEIGLSMDSHDSFYSDISEYKRSQILRILRNYDRKHLTAYLFNYHIKGVGVIKDTKAIKSITRERIGG